MTRERRIQVEFESLTGETVCCSMLIPTPALSARLRKLDGDSGGDLEGLKILKAEVSVGNTDADRTMVLLDELGIDEIVGIFREFNQLLAPASKKPTS